MVFTTIKLNGKDRQIKGDLIMKKLLILILVFIFPVIAQANFENFDFEGRHVQDSPDGTEAPNHWISIDPGDVLISDDGLGVGYMAKILVGKYNIGSGPKGLRSYPWSSPDVTAGSSYTISIKVFIEEFNDMATKNITMKTSRLGTEELNFVACNGTLNENEWHTFTTTWTPAHSDIYSFMTFFNLDLSELPNDPDPFVWYFDDFSIILTP